MCFALKINLFVCFHAIDIAQPGRLDCEKQATFTKLKK